MVEQGKVGKAVLGEILAKELYLGWGEGLQQKNPQGGTRGGENIFY